MWYKESALLLLIAFAIAVAEQALVLIKRARDQPHTVVVLLGLTTVGFLGLFAALVVADEKNSAAVFGLLGVLGGFLAGRATIGSH